MFCFYCDTSARCVYKGYSLCTEHLLAFTRLSKKDDGRLSMLAAARKNASLVPVMVNVTTIDTIGKSFF